MCHKWHAEKCDVLQKCCRGSGLSPILRSRRNPINPAPAGWSVLMCRFFGMSELILGKHNQSSHENADFVSETSYFVILKGTSKNPINNLVKNSSSVCCPSTMIRTFILLLKCSIDIHFLQIMCFTDLTVSRIVKIRDF